MREHIKERLKHNKTLVNICLCNIIFYLTTLSILFWRLTEARSENGLGISYSNTFSMLRDHLTRAIASREYLLGTKFSPQYTYEDKTNYFEILMDNRSGLAILIVFLLYILIVLCLKASDYYLKSEQRVVLDKLGSTKLQAFLMDAKKSVIYLAITSVISFIAGLIVNPLIMLITNLVAESYYKLDLSIYTEPLGMLTIALFFMFSSFIIMLIGIIVGYIRCRIALHSKRTEKKHRIPAFLRNNYISPGISAGLISIVLLSLAYFILFNINCFNKFDYSVTNLEDKIQLRVISQYSHNGSTKNSGDADNQDDKIEYNLYNNIWSMCEDKCFDIHYNCAMVNLFIEYTNNPVSEYLNSSLEINSYFIHNGALISPNALDNDNTLYEKNDKILNAHIKNNYNYLTTENYRLYSKKSLKSLEPYIIEGEIHPDAVDNGDEIILCLPAFYMLSYQHFDTAYYDYYGHNLSSYAKHYENDLLHVGDSISIVYYDADGNINFHPLKIGAILNTADIFTLITTNNVLNKLKITPNINELDMSFKDASSMNDAYAKLSSLPDYDVFNFYENNQADKNYITTKNITSYTGAVLLIALAILITYLSIHNRFNTKKETLRLLRSVGATIRQLLKSIIINTSIISAIVIVAGSISSILVVKNNYFDQYSKWFEWPTHLLIAIMLAVIYVGSTTLLTYKLLFKQDITQRDDYR